MDTSTQGVLSLCEDKGRDWSDVSTRRGEPRTAGSHRKLEEAREDSPLELPKGERGPADTLISDF